MGIHEFVWPEDRIDHIARHGVTPNEVEEACFGRALVQRAKSEGQNPVYYVLGQTDSIEELARFWDNHDLTDFEDQLEEMSEPVFERRGVVNLRLTSEDAEAVAQLAKAQGVAPAELIREWVREKLHAS